MISYVIGENVTYFDSFGVAYIPKEILEIHIFYHHNKYL